jgi:hypothetical protein
MTLVDLLNPERGWFSALVQLLAIKPKKICAHSHAFQKGAREGRGGIISNPVARSFVQVATGSGGLLALPTRCRHLALGGSAGWFNSNKVATNRHPVKGREVTHGFHYHLLRI